MGTEKIQKTIKIFVNRIKKRYNPEKIILFGSYARGEATVYSDIDILVVAQSFKGQKPYDRFVDLHRLATDLQPDINAFAFTPEELRNSKHITTIRDAVASGVTLD